jgi:hypothetical protein
MSGHKRAGLAVSARTSDREVSHYEVVYLGDLCRGGLRRSGCVLRSVGAQVHAEPAQLPQAGYNPANANTGDSRGISRPPMQEPPRKIVATAQPSADPHRPGAPQAPAV